MTNPTLLPAQGKHPTVKDVAERANVSASTVSNVLHNRPHVTAEIRGRVEAAIAATGYRPSLAGRQLRNGRSNTVSLAIPDIRSPYFSELAHAVIVEAQRNGLTLLIDETGGDLAREREIAAGYPDRGIEGIVFCPITISVDELEQLKSDVPTVLLGENVADAPFDHIAIDSLKSAQEATEHLLQLGRRRIAFAGYQPGAHMSPGTLRLAGVRNALESWGLTLPDDLVLQAPEWTREQGQHIAELIIPRLGEIDALVCAADVLAVGALKGFNCAGVRVPDDVAILAWDNSPEGRFTSPALTTIGHDLGGIARFAVRSLALQQADASLAPRKHTASHTLIVRGSTSLVGD